MVNIPVHNTGKMESSMRPRGKPFWKSKGFWGSVIAIATPLVPLPFQPIVAVAGGVVAMVGRAKATQPLAVK